MIGCTLWSGHNGTALHPVPVEWKVDRDFPPEFPMDSITETDRPLDIAIIGAGYFQCTDLQTDERVYTRKGNFSVNPDGRLVFYLHHSNEQQPTITYLFGYSLCPEIAVPLDAVKIEITDNGIVVAWTPQSAIPQQLGQIELAIFANPRNLLQVAENLYRETESSGPPAGCFPGTHGAGFLKQRYLEVSHPEAPEVIAQ